MSLIKSKVFYALLIGVVVYLLVAGASLLHEYRFFSIPESWGAFHLSATSYTNRWLVNGFVFALVAWFIVTAQDSGMNQLLKTWVASFAVFVVWAFVLYVLRQPDIAVGAICYSGYLTVTILVQALKRSPGMSALTLSAGVLLYVQAGCLFTTQLLMRQQIMTVWGAA